MTDSRLGLAESVPDPSRLFNIQMHGIGQARPMVPVQRRISAGAGCCSANVDKQQLQVAGGCANPDDRPLTPNHSGQQLGDRSGR